VEYAWLERNKHSWRLCRKNSPLDNKKWGDEFSALEELQEEGWEIATVYYKEEPDNAFRAYGLVRSIH